MLSKILLCRTAILRGHKYRCPSCQSEIHLYNSCSDRHCPQCGGAKRGNWFAKTEEVLLHGVPYFHIVFTLPDHFSSVILGNRRLLYDLLFQSAWRALDQELRRTGKFHPAAQMVLHTCNQQLEHHPHLHVLVPGGGPALDDGRWLPSRHPTQRRRRKPYLTDHVALGRLFRDAFLRGFRRLVRRDRLRLEATWARLKTPAELERWLAPVERMDWNVFIEGPPDGKSGPEAVLKYLAHYLTGGPISDRRMVREDDEGIWFLARPKQGSRRRGRMRAARPFRLSGKQFVYRWSLHVLPKGYTRTRSYGGYHGSKRTDYLAQCREGLPLPLEESASPTGDLPLPLDCGPKCPQCALPMECVSSERRPSWRQIFSLDIYRARVYSPMCHVPGMGFPVHAADPYG